MKKRACRMTSSEKDRHALAVKVRKMTDEQLVEFVGVAAAGNTANNVDQFLLELSAKSGSGNGIGQATVNKLRRIADEGGYLDAKDA